MEKAFSKKVVGIKNIENCYNITSLIPNSKEKEYIAFISPYEDHLVKISIFGYQSKEAYFQFVINDAEAFVDRIPKIMDSKIKAVVILRVYQFQCEKLPINVQFCKSLKAKLDAITTKIPYCFISDFNFWTAKVLVAANISVNFAEFVLVLMTVGKIVNMVELKYTKAGYEVVRQALHHIDEIDGELGEEILGTNELQKIVFCSDKPDKPLIKTLKNILKAESKKFIFVDDMENNKYICAGVIEESKWILDKKYTKFHVLPTTERAYIIGFERGEEEVPIFLEESTVALPYEKIVIASKSSSNHFIGYFDMEKRKNSRLETFALGDDNCHEYEITLKVDVHNQLSYTVRGINVQQIIDFPSLCNEQMDDEVFERYPVIGFYDNNSFICIWDDTKEEYKFLDSWGGQWGKPTHIAFDKEKPYFGKAAEETFVKYGKFVVCDLLEVMISTEEELQEYEHESFTFKKDAENPVLIEFDTFDGTKKAASPAFLMALLLKKHLKAIKKETGEKPNGLGFCILEDFDWEDIGTPYTWWKLHLVESPPNVTFSTKCNVLPPSVNILPPSVLNF